MPPQSFIITMQLHAFINVDALQIIISVPTRIWSCPSFNKNGSFAFLLEGEGNSKNLVRIADANTTCKHRMKPVCATKALKQFQKSDVLYTTRDNYTVVIVYNSERNVLDKKFERAMKL